MLLNLCINVNPVGTTVPKAMNTLSLVARIW
jgi:hypothetical protein